MPNEVDQIKAHLDIVDVVGEYVKLKQSGQNWKGLCPFHGEKTPSFMVHREKQIWHCFGCSIGGDIFEFIQKIENIDFPEALQLLAKKANVELRPQDRQEHGKRTRLLELVEAADNYWHDLLLKSPGARTARDYLKERQVDSDLAKTFHLGFSPELWDGTIKYLTSKGYKIEELLTVGLAARNAKGTVYDKFHSRLMFPITDIHGRTIGFGARVLGSKKADEPKYMNSPQSPVYNKSYVLYNLHRAAPAIKQAGYAVLVEGYMDVIGCYQAGITNVVATSGTALTVEQLKLLKRYTKELRLAFDADLAGQSAAERGIDLALEAELEVKIISLPTGEDPDTWARKQPAKFKELIDAAQPIGDYTLSRVITSFDIKNRQGKKTAADTMLKAISKLPNPIEKDFYLKQVSQVMGVAEANLRERLALFSAKKHEPIKVDQEALASIPISRQQLMTERLLALAINNPDWLVILGRELSPNWLATSLEQELYRRLLVYYTERKQLSLDELKLELASEPKLINLLERLWIQASNDFTDYTPEQEQHELDTLIGDLKKNYLTSELKLISESIRQAENKGDQPELTRLLESFKDLSKELSNQHNHAQD